MPFCLSETISEQQKRRERKWEGAVFDAKGQMSGADDGVCVCNLCLTAHACVSILIYFCLSVWHICMCVCVCVTGR